MLGDFQVIESPRICNKQNHHQSNKIKGQIFFLKYRPKDLTVVVCGILISLIGILVPILLYIPIKMGIIAEDRFTAYAQQQTAVSDPLSEFLQIAQSKVQAATALGAFGHGVPSLYNLSIQDLLMMLGITGAGCILAYVIVRILLKRAREKEKDNSRMVMYQQ